MTEVSKTQSKQLTLEEIELAKAKPYTSTSNEFVSYREAAMLLGFSGTSMVADMVAVGNLVPVGAFGDWLLLEDVLSHIEKTNDSFLGEGGVTKKSNPFRHIKGWQDFINAHELSTYDELSSIAPNGDVEALLSEYAPLFNFARGDVTYYPVFQFSNKPEDVTKVQCMRNMLPDYQDVCHGIGQLVILSSFNAMYRS